MTWDLPFKLRVSSSSILWAFDRYQLSCVVREDRKKEVRDPMKFELQIKLITHRPSEYLQPVSYIIWNRQHIST